MGLHKQVLLRGLAAYDQLTLLHLTCFRIHSILDSHGSIHGGGVLSSLSGVNTLGALLADTGVLKRSQFQLDEAHVLHGGAGHLAFFNGNYLTLSLGNDHAVIRNVGDKSAESNRHHEQRFKLLHHTQIQHHCHNTPHHVHLPGHLVDTHAGDEAREGIEKFLHI